MDTGHLLERVPMRSAWLTGLPSRRFMRLVRNSESRDGMRFFKVTGNSTCLQVRLRYTYRGIPYANRKVERDERIHASQRRLVSQIYSMETLKGLEQYIDGAVTQFSKKLQDRLGQNIDMGLFVQLFAFDVVGEVTYASSESMFPLLR